MATLLPFPEPDRLPDIKAARKQLLAHCGKLGFPAEMYLDAEAGPAITAEGNAALKKMFDFFGVTELEPNGENFELVLDTWFALNRVCSDIRARHMFFDTVYRRDSARWSAPYREYVEALWAGDRAALLDKAQALGITRGIAETDPELRERAHSGVSA